MDATNCRRGCTTRGRMRPRDHGTPVAVDYVDVTVVDFAAHTAYLEPLTGTGLLILPPPETDLPPPGPAENWPPTADDRPSRGLSLLSADWESVLHELDQLGWMLLDDESGQPETAGRTPDGRTAICLYGDSAVIDEPSMADIRRALTGLRLAAGLGPEDF